jgi:predicted MFS family arabinose efflux permease
MAATTSVPVWLGLRLVAGLASAVVFVAVSTNILGILAQHDRPDLAGWLYSGVGLGIALTGAVVLIVGRWVEQRTQAWRAEWITVAVLALLLMSITWTWFPRSSTGTRGRHVSGSAQYVGWGIFALLGGAYFLEGAGYIVSGTFLPTLVANVPGLPGSGAGVWILVGLAGIPSTILWARAAARVEQLAVLASAYALQAVGVALPVIVPRAWADASAAILFGGTFMGITALTIAFSRGHAPAGQGTAVIGLLTAAFALGQVTGPLVAARVAGDSAGFAAAFLVAALVVAVGGVLVLAASVMTRRERAGAFPP